MKGRQVELDILNCGASGQVVFEVVCPVTWGEMDPTGDPRQRRCGQCQRRVYRCHDANEAGLRADQGECIAVPTWLAQGVRDHDDGRVVTIGMPRSRRELFAEIVEARLDGGEG